MPSTRSRRRGIAALLVALVAASTIAGQPVARADHTVPTPTITEPPDGLRGYPLFDSYYDLEPHGYEEQEYFVSGVATNASGTATAPYTTRIIVTRPAGGHPFNGTVLLDWVNVTAQFENAVDTMLAREMLMREGYAYVHVSAQAAGICCTPLTPKVWDPVRYATLNHPGDAFAFDLLTQIAQAFRIPSSDPGSLDPMGALGVASVQRVLAAGQSQSANQLSGYIRDWLPNHPEAQSVIDGILVHGNVPGAKAFAAAAPIPVLQLLSDFEAVNDGIDPATLPANHRLWEIAGAAHSDFYIGYQSEAGHGPRVLAGRPKLTAEEYRAVLETAGNYGEELHPLLAACTLAGATMPMRYATSAAIHGLNQWVAGGTAPPNGPRFHFAGTQLARDQFGNTLGGIRLPPIDVPVATYASTTCQLGGITLPFTEAQLLALYGSHANYYGQMVSRTNDALNAGWLLPADAADLLRRACEAAVRFPLSAPGC